MQVKDLKALLKGVSGETEIKVIIPDRNFVNELKDVKVEIEDTVIFMAE